MADNFGLVSAPVRIAYLVPLSVVANFHSSLEFPRAVDKLYVSLGRTACPCAYLIQQHATYLSSIDVTE